MTRRNFLSFLAVALLGFTLAACQPQAQAQPQAKNTQAQIAQEAANSIVFTDNAEIKNIKDRIELTSKPGALGYVILLNNAGQPIAYYGVRGKITSGSKRLTKPFDVKQYAIGGSNGGATYVQTPSPSDEGTWGSSGDYVFFWTTDGQYIQWSGQYLYSDKPLRLRVEPLVISVVDAQH